MQNIARIVTDVTKVSNLAENFLSTCQLILEGVPVTNGPNYRKKGGLTFTYNSSGCPVVSTLLV